jgi:HD-like signal output (HDOD) protein
MSKQVLFVDDEPNVLDGLKRMLHGMRDEWDMSFCNSGPEALALMGTRPFDVVVSDMRMPGMDGAQLLGEVMQRYPRSVRIILSGQSDRESILRSIGPTHQYLVKPCDGAQLKETVARSCALRDLLGDERLKGLAAQMSSLPVRPAVYSQVVGELQMSNSSLKKIGALISQDAGMTAKVLQLVNSSFFGLGQKVSSQAQAVSMLGLDTISSIFLGVSVFSQFQDGAQEGFLAEKFWAHSAAVGAVARKIAVAEDQPASVVGDAMMAGLMHDVGKLVLGMHLPGPYQDAMARARSGGLEDWKAEREVLGASHAEVGAYLIGLWGIPDSIVEGIAFHHEPHRCLKQSFGVLTAVHVANALVNEGKHGAAGGSGELDLQHLRETGTEHRLEAWRALVSDLPEE